MHTGFLGESGQLLRKVLFAGELIRTLSHNHYSGGLLKKNPLSGGIVIGPSALSAQVNRTYTRSLQFPLSNIGTDYLNFVNLKPKKIFQRWKRVAPMGEVSLNASVRPEDQFQTDTR